MGKTNVKYILKESELTELIAEMILSEAYDPNAFTANHFPGEKSTAPTSMKSVLGGAGKVLTAGWNGIKDLAGQAGDWFRGGGIQRMLGNDGESHSGDYDHFTKLYGGMYMSRYGTNIDYSKAPAKCQGRNFDAHEPFNAQAAANYILSHATKHYVKGQNGYCATGVINGLKAGGLSAPWGMYSNYACFLTAILPSNGWYEIPHSEAGQVGDVMVLDPCTSKNGSKHPMGHTAMCCGNGVWGCDFIHSKGNVAGTASPPPANAMHFFRYKNIQ